MQVSTTHSDRLHLIWLTYSFGNRLLFKTQGKQIRSKRNTSSNVSITAITSHDGGGQSPLLLASPTFQHQNGWLVTWSWFAVLPAASYIRREKMQQIFPNIFYIDSFSCIPKSVCSQTEKIKRFSQSHMTMEAVYQCIVQMMFKNSHYYRNLKKSQISVNSPFTLT